MTIAELLDACGFPWRISRQDLIARFGITKHPAYQWDIIAVESDTALVKGLLYPFDVQQRKNLAPYLPAIHFSSATWFGPDARRNFRRTAEELARKLGKPQDRHTSNTIGCTWKNGASAITLTAWPKDLDTLGPTSNPAHERDPRLGEACHIVIETGFKPPLSDAERAMLDTFEPFAELAYGHHFDAQSITARPAFAGTLEFVREPPTDLTRVFRKIGLSTDRTTLIFCHTQLYLVPVRAIGTVALTRLKRGRGPGGARLSLHCAAIEPGQPVKSITVDERSSEPTSLDLFANQLAQRLAKPLTTAEGYDD